ncbi:MAG: BadF/BadG/BcrA/BcrD ATPase family protein, partial [Clostridia bacterium]
MKYFLAVDGGGTKTISAVFDSDGCRLSEGLSKSANALLSSIDEATDNVIESCSLALAKAGLAFSNIEKIYLFIPGFGECIDNFSHKVGAECVLEKEGNALHYSAFRGKDGVIALAGTGSFAVTYYNDNVYKAGGWGTIYGDEGSGYEIGAMALRLCAIAFDEGRETELLCAVKKELNIQDFNDTRGYIYGNKDSRRIVAGLCKVVCQKAQESESESVEILKECAHNLAELTMRSFTMSGSRS